VVADFSQPLTTDWPKEIADSTLWEDLDKCFTGNPQTRFSGGRELAKSLRFFGDRKMAHQAEHVALTARQKAAHRRGVVWKVAVAASVVVVIGALAVFAMFQSQNAKKEARRADRLEFRDKVGIITEETLRIVEANRKAAEWVVALGGRVKIRVNGEEREIKTTAELPRTAFQIFQIDTQSKHVTDLDLKQLEGLTELNFLLLQDASVTDTGLACLLEMTKLESLHLERTPVTDSIVERFKRLQYLRNLWVDGAPITDLGLAHLSQRDMHRLVLTGTRISDEGLKQVSAMSNLTDLVVERTQITDEGFAHLHGMTNLHLLGLSHTKVTDAGFKYVEGLSQLEGLSLDATSITDAGLEYLKNLTNMWYLSFSDTHVTDAGLVYLKTMKRLHKVYLNNTKISSAGLQHLKNLTDLRRLGLERTQVTDAGLEQLQGLPLWELNLSDTQITDAGLIYLKKFNALQLLYLRGTKVTDAGVAELKTVLPKCEIQR
jgi:Leucine-rich repeat (LRR) protein